MARESTIHIGVINIAMHSPHSAMRYVELFEALYQRRKIIGTRGTTGTLIGALHPINRDNPEQGLNGEFYQFIHLDPNEPWFDLDNNEEATQDEVNGIEIPEHLKPHLARFPFVFFPNGHRLYIQLKNKHRSFGVQSAAKVMTALLADSYLSNFGQIEVTIQPDLDSVNTIFRIPTLHHLKIELVRPNPDDHDDAERRLLERLENQGASKMVVTLSAPRYQSLSPDVDTRTLATVAASNGYVYAVGRDDSNTKIELSTKQFPLTERFRYDSEVQTANDALIQKAREIHTEITTRR